MRCVKFAGLLTVMLLAVVTLAAAGLNQFGASDTYNVTFTDPVRVAGTLLPKGDYEIRHTMQGQEHIMVFRQLGKREPVEVRAKCSLVPLSVKATETQKIYVVNAANERELRELIFKGDKAKHVF